MPLYKHTRREFSMNSLKLGAIWLGTLENYRNVEKHALGIGDDQEGVVSITEHFDNFHIEEAQEDMLLGGSAISLGKGCTDFRLVNVTSSYKQYSPNYLIYSMSRSKERLTDSKLMDPSYDVCFEINDPHRFCKLVTRSIPGQPRFLGLFNCQYEKAEAQRAINSELDLAVPLTTKYPPFICKDPTFGPQQEVRAVWGVPWLEATPFGILNSEVIELLTLS